MTEITLLASGLDGVLSGVDLFITIINLVALGGGAIFMASMFAMNAIGWGDDQAQKGRTAAAKKSATYIVLTLIIIDVVFGGIKLFGLDKAGDASHSTVSEFLQDGADAIDSGNYNQKLSDDDSGDYGNGNGGSDDLNFGE